MDEYTHINFFSRLINFSIYGMELVYKQFGFSSYNNKLEVLYERNNILGEVPKNGHSEKGLESKVRKII